MKFDNPIEMGVVEMKSVERSLRLIENDVFRGNYRMFQLPGYPELSLEEVEVRSRSLNKKYNDALEQERERAEKQSEISQVIENTSNESHNLEKIKNILRKYPEESTYQLAIHARSLSDETQNQVVQALIETSPRETANNLRYLPGRMLDDSVCSLLERAPQEVSEGIIVSFRLLSEKVRNNIAYVIIEKAPKEIFSKLSYKIQYLSLVETRDEIAQLLMEKSPQESADGIARSIANITEGEIRNGIIQALLEKAPNQAATGLINNIDYVQEGEFRDGVVYNLFSQAPNESAVEIANNLACLTRGKVRDDIAVEIVKKFSRESAVGIAMNFSNIEDGGVQERLLQILVQEAPEELSYAVVYLEDGVQHEVIQRLLKEAPYGSASGLIAHISSFSIAIQKEIVLVLIEKTPLTFVPTLEASFRRIPQEYRDMLAKRLLEEVPYESARALESNFRWLSAELQERVNELLPEAEKDELESSERLNPSLYKGVDLKSKFLRKDFFKDGGETVILGDKLINKLILRIIPSHGFISWLEAYSAIDTWKGAGFYYVPIEPIMEAHLLHDNKNTRVYTGVLGVTVKRYLEMKFNSSHHEEVMKKVDAIRDVLQELGIVHGHLHLENFCILHERTREGEIDWDKPPRVYCIDFDAATSPNTTSTTPIPNKIGGNFD